MSKFKNQILNIISVLFISLIAFAMLIGFVKINTNQSTGTLKADPTIVDSGNCGYDSVYQDGEANNSCTYTLYSDGLLVIQGNDYIHAWSFSRESYAYYTDIISVRIESGVLGIGMYVFEYCSNIVSVEFPNTLQEIGCRCFEGCSSLTEVTLPASVTTISYDWSAACPLLTKIRVLGTSPATLTGKGDEKHFFGGYAETNNGELPGMDEFLLTPQQAHIYVPDDYVETYKSEWSNYADYIVAQSTYVADSGSSGSGSAIVENTGVILNAVLPSLTIVLSLGAVLFVLKKSNNSSF